MSSEISERTAYPGRIPDEVFEADRERVLASWPTGADVDIDEGVAFHKELPAEKNWAKRIAQAYADGITLAWPRTGKALLQEHIDDLVALYEDGAQLHATTADSYTRTQRYDQAADALAESAREGRSMLNGLPVVNHGVERTREVVTGTPIANQFRTGTPDARLSAEVILNAGYRALQGGMLGTSLPFMKDLPISEAIRNWQQVERLVGVYQSRGVDIHREYYGALMGMIMPPSIMCASLIFDGLMAAEQGVKHITLGTNNNMHVLQDVAALHVVQRVGRSYLDDLGFSDVTLTPLLYMWMGQFPHGEGEANGLIGLGAVTAALGGAAATVVKTPDEAFGVATTASNGASVRLTKTILDLTRGQRLPDSEEQREEMAMIERETRAIVDTALKLGDGRVATGVVEAYKAGTMDVPFSPARGNAGRALPVRDASGAVRFLEFGSLPFDQDIKDFHKQRVEQRIKRDHAEAAPFSMVVKDVSLETFQPRETIGAPA